MKRTLVTALAALALAVPAAQAQGPGPGYGPGPRGPMARHFDPNSVTTVSGQVAAVTTVDGRRRQGVHLQLTTSTGTTEVRLGPAWYLEQQGLKLAQGDAVEVTGSQLSWDGRDVIVAQVVKKGDATVTLRDANGVPAWAGWGRR